MLADNFCEVLCPLHTLGPLDPVRQPDHGDVHHRNGAAKILVGRDDESIHEIGDTPASTPRYLGSLPLCEHRRRITQDCLNIHAYRVAGPELFLKLPKDLSVPIQVDAVGSRHHYVRFTILSALYGSRKRRFVKTRELKILQQPEAFLPTDR